MPENPLQTFGKALGGLGAGLQGRPNPFMEQDLARERMAQQERQFGQTLQMQEAQFKQSQAQFEKTYKLSTSAHAASILKALTDAGIQLDPDTADKVGGTLLDAMLGGLATQGDAGAEAILQEPGVSKTLGRQLFTGGLKLDDIVKSYQLVHPSQVPSILKRNRLDQKEIGPELKRVGDQNVEAASNALKALAPQVVQAFRKVTPAFADPNTSIPEGQLMAWIGTHRKDFLEALGGQYTPSALNAALVNLRQDDTLLAGLNVTTGKAAGDFRAAEAKATSPVIQKAEIAKAAATGLAVEVEKRKAPAMPKERAEHIDVEALRTRGELIQPPAGITSEDLAKGAYAAIKPDQAERWTATRSAQTYLGNLETLDQRLITATNASEAVRQGIQHSIEAATGSNPLAVAYHKELNAFSDSFGRAYMGQKGVMTERYSKRIVGGFGSFFDTVESRNLKRAFMRDITEAGNQALINEITGKEVGPYRSRVKELVEKFDRETVDAVLGGIKPNERVIRHQDTFEIRVQPASQAVPKGFVPVTAKPLGSNIQEFHRVK